MKKLYNKVPLQSVLYFIPGTTRIVIEDYLRASVIWDNAKPVYTWEGLAANSHNLPNKYTYAAVCGMEISPENPNTLVFRVSTEFEEY